MLRLIDLDNTLIDRTGAFKSWAVEYVPKLDGDASDIDWIIAATRMATTRASGSMPGSVPDSASSLTEF